jgi:thiamine-monophosphate kinase
VRSFTEDELLEALQRLIPTDAPGVLVGLGDDAAVLDQGDRDGLVTVDMLVEGVDFRLDAVAARDLGYRALAVNLSDIAAMGGSPRHAVVALGIPVATEPGWVVELYGGMLDAAGEHAVSIVGGDLSGSEQIVLSVTVLGEAAQGRTVRRTGAHPGDRLVVTGRLGAAAGGLRLLEAGPRAVASARTSGWGEPLLAAHLRPVARVGEGQVLAAEGATAMIDVSDGLAKDLGRLCSASGVGAVVRVEAVPVASGLFDLQPVTSDDPVRLALTGGEDFELLAALPFGTVAVAQAVLSERFGTPLTDIGEVTDGEGMLAEWEDGSRAVLEAEGWDHFAR